MYISVKPPCRRAVAALHWRRLNSGDNHAHRALKLGNAPQVAPIDKLSVVVVAIFGALFLGEQLSPPNWLGVALIAGGAVLVAYKG